MTISINFTGYNGLSQTRFIDSNRTGPARSLSNPTVRLESKGSFSSVTDSVKKFASAVAHLGSEEAFLGTKASSSDRDALQVSIGSSASVGEHKIEVTQLAQKQITSSTNGFTNTTDVVADGGSISFTVNGSTTTPISISSDTTLAELRDLINNQNSGVVASISNDAIENKLVLSSRYSGSGQGFTLNNSLTNSGGNAIKFETGQSSISGNTQNAQNANFTVDGVQFNRASNNVSDAVEGLTFTLAKKASATITVSADSGEVRKVVDEFVNEYNKLDDAAERLSKSGTLSSDRVALGTALRHLSRETRSAIGSSPKAKKLADVGITFDKNSKLQLDKKKLDAALASRPDDVKTLFAGDTGKRGVFARLSGRLGVQKTAGGTIQPKSPSGQDYLSSQSLASKLRRLGRFDTPGALQDVIRGINNSSTALGRINIRA